MRSTNGNVPTVKQLDVLPFDAPREGRVLSNYLVSYELAAKSGVAYKGGFTVYIFESTGKCHYAVKEPYLDPRLSSVVAGALDSLSTWLAPSPIVDLDPIGYLLAEMERTGILRTASREDLSSCTHYLIRDILGYWLLDPLLRDPEIEDISCEGSTSCVKVWHRRYNSSGWLETNVHFTNQEQLDAIVTRLVHRSGRSISTFSPIVDSVLPEGFRLTATWRKEVTSAGSSFTIRKQRAEPFTISELIKIKSLSPAIAAYLWLMLDLKGFVIVSGVTASGKTTLLNSLATVLNPSWKIVSIEDTREISLEHSGWKPLHTRSIQGGPSITLFDLVKLSLRERPDFVILGEVRGQEVQALFQSAASGSGCITTFHSANLESMIARLTQPPLSVSSSLLSLIDAVVFMVRSPDGSARSVRQVVEMGDKPITVFSKIAGSNNDGGGNDGWDGTAELSQRLSMRAEGYGYSARRLAAELERRQQFVEAIMGKGVSDYGTLSSELRQFYVSSSLTA
jgi:flagellar protein FlaI